jgi:hypothetical protein
MKGRGAAGARARGWDARALPPLRRPLISGRRSGGRVRAWRAAHQLAAAAGRPAGAEAVGQEGGCVEWCSSRASLRHGRQSDTLLLPPSGSPLVRA